MHQYLREELKSLDWESILCKCILDLFFRDRGSENKDLWPHDVWRIKETPVKSQHTQWQLSNQDL